MSVPDNIRESLTAVFGPELVEVPAHAKYFGYFPTNAVPDLPMIRGMRVVGWRSAEVVKGNGSKPAFVRGILGLEPL